MKEREVKEIKKIEKQLKEREIQQQESLVIEGTLLEAILSTDGTTLDASLATKGTALDAYLVTEGATLEACFVTEGEALKACLATKGIIMDDNLDAKESTYDYVTSSEQLDESSGLGNDEDAKKMLVDTVSYDIENAGIRPSYDSDTVSKVHHETFENVFSNEIHSHEQPDSISDTYVVNENNSDIIFNIPNMDSNRDKEEHDYVDYEQQRSLFVSLINNLRCDAEKCKKVNREAQQANAVLTNELERYKQKEKHFAKETTN
uniref:Uncharacterized protein n=1 Tax=Tanacetum cinerariifolium TaxID=118510 RepID=A0A6L2NDZ3_TANCI|nr:hypothetical protein [Tanacetum cinerariifolium]